MQNKPLRYAHRVQVLLLRHCAGEFARSIADPEAILSLRLATTLEHRMDPVWRAAYQRGHIAQAMRDSEVVYIRRLASQLDAESAAAAIEKVLSGASK